MIDLGVLVDTLGELKVDGVAKVGPAEVRVAEVDAIFLPSVEVEKIRLAKVELDEVGIVPELGALWLALRVRTRVSFFFRLRGPRYGTALASWPRSHRSK